MASTTTAAPNAGSRRHNRRGGYHHNPAGDDDHAVVQVVYQIVQEPRLVPRNSATPATLTGPGAPRVHTFRVPATASEREPDAFGRAEDAHASTLVAPHDISVPNPAFLLPPISSSDESGDGTDDDEAALLNRGGPAIATVASTVAVAGNPFRVPVPRPTVVQDAWIPSPAFGTFTALMMGVTLMLTLAMIEMPIYGSVAADGTKALVFPWRVEYCPRPDDGSVLPCEAWPLSEAATAAKYINDSCAGRISAIAACIVLLNIAAVAAVVLGLLEGVRKEPFPFAAMVPTALCIALSGCVWGLTDKAVERQECRLQTAVGFDLAVAVFALSWVPMCVTWLRLLRPECCMASAEFDFETKRENERARQVVTERDGRRDNRTDPDVAGTVLEQMHIDWWQRLVPGCVLVLVLVAVILVAVAFDAKVAKRGGRDFNVFLQLFNRLRTCAFDRLGDQCHTTAASDTVGGVCVAHLNGASALLVLALVGMLGAVAAIALEMRGRLLMRKVAVALCLAACALCFVAYAVIRAALERGYCWPFTDYDSTVSTLAVAAGSLLACVLPFQYTMLCRHHLWGLSYHDQLRLERADRINAAEEEAAAAAAAAAAAVPPAAAGEEVEGAAVAAPQEPLNADASGAVAQHPVEDEEMQPVPGQATPSAKNPIVDPDASSSSTIPPA